MTSSIRPVKGTRDFYPETMAQRNWLHGLLREVSEMYGYQEFEAPLVEPIELYAAKSGEELVKEQAFVFPDKSGELITLRPELTPSLARMVAQRQQQLTFPLRWWSYGPFWRYERPQKGRGREFFQWNIDLIGVDTPEADAEIVAVAVDFLRKAGLSPQETSILVNNRHLMEQKLSNLDIVHSLHSQVFRLIDRKQKLKPANWLGYAQNIGLSENQIQGLEILLQNHSLWKGFDELERFFIAIQAYRMDDYVQFDPNIIRGLDYYTGTVFECWERTGTFRAIFGGGRYDNLVAEVGGNPLPAVGFAMGDMVISLVLDKYGKLPSQPSTSPAPILVTVFNEELLTASLSLAADLRQTGLNVSCYPEVAKLNKQLKYADRVGAKVALLLGPDEHREGAVTVKDLENRSQFHVPRTSLVAQIKQILDGD